MTILILFFGTLALSFLASLKVKHTYRKYLEIPSLNGLTGAQAAHKILSDAGIDNVAIEICPGELTDHYDPHHKKLVLSEKNYHGDSISAVAVAAHEAGHALQHAHAYAPLHLRMAAVGITRIASSLVMVLPILGLLTGLIAPYTAAGILAAGWAIIMLFNLITLPVEFDASSRAKAALQNSGILTQSETGGVDKVLNAAALTYVAAFLTSLAYFLYHVLPLLLGRRE